MPSPSHDTRATVVCRRHHLHTVAGAAPDWREARTGFPFHPMRGGMGHLKSVGIRTPGAERRQARRVNRFECFLSAVHSRQMCQKL
ncbi:hypothetical protein EMIT047CA2_180018 [Pseudomonas soli]